jgi:hypothetical protein
MVFPETDESALHSNSNCGRHRLSISLRSILKIYQLLGLADDKNIKSGKSIDSKQQKIQVLYRISEYCDHFGL